MAYGLVIYAANGNVKIDASDRLTRHYARYSLSVPGWSSAFISVPGLSTDGTWGVSYVMPVPALTPHISADTLKFYNNFSSAYSVQVDIWRV